MRSRTVVRVLAIAGALTLVVGLHRLLGDGVDGLLVSHENNGEMGEVDAALTQS